MRIVFAAALLIAPAATQPAQADDPYKWCAVYGGNAIDGSKGCWFTTYEQCLATVTGLAGWCIPNAFSSESDAAPSKRMKKRVAAH